MQCSLSTEAICCTGSDFKMSMISLSAQSLRRRRRRRRKKAASVHGHYLRKVSAQIQSSCYSNICADNFLMSLTVCYQQHLSLLVSVGGEDD